MKSVIISDIHLGKYKYGKVNAETGHDLRTDDIIGNVDQSIDFAIEKKVDAFIVDGDFFHKKKPMPIFRRVFTNRINRILSNGIEVFLLLGNHDQGKTSGHDLVELCEISEQLDKLHVIEKPQCIEFKDSLLCFLPCVNKIDYESTCSEVDFNMQQIPLLTAEASKSKKTYKIFFGHFGTDHSIAGKSFDLGTITDQDAKHVRVVPLDAFDPKVWTKVYLGDIHKPQMLNDFCRHVGSIARVDFGEEDEEKGFFLFENGKDTFINVKDREFKTLFVDLEDDKPRDVMKEFCDTVQDIDISQAIVRLKINIKTSDKPLINFSYLEQYLQEQSWNYIGKTIIELSEDRTSVSLSTNDELDHVDLFKKYVTQTLKDKVDKDQYQVILDEGMKILSEVLNK